MVSSDPVTPADGETRDPAPNSDPWADGMRRPWRVQLAPGRVVLRSLHDDHVVDVPARNWASDIHAISHGDGFIIRFSTFDREVGFVVAAEQAESLLRHIGQWPDAPPQHLDVQIDDDDAPVDRPLLWPKVSPLAVWALICSSMVFVPILGLVPAAATVVLLLLHHRTVRPARVWSHSRALCKVAVVFLLGGLAVEVIATVGCVRNLSRSPDPYDQLEFNAADEQTSRVTRESAEVSNAGMLGSSSFLERKINWGLLVAALFVLIISLSFHEAGHAISAWWLGDDFARRTGRVTLNPIQHIDPVGTILVPLILFVVGFAIFGWAKPVPVQIDHVPRPRRAHILISIAGPGANLLIAAASIALLLAITTVVGLTLPDAQVNGLVSPQFANNVTASGFPLASAFAAICTILKLSFTVNVFLAFFNLIPIPPLDGSWVLENLFPFTMGPVYARLRPYSLLLFAAFIYTGAFQFLFTPIAFVLAPGFSLLASSTPFR